jgi:RNA polymerase sigma factor (sigma-70 family)
VIVSAENQGTRISELIAREWGRLVGFVRSWIADTAEREAEDIVQDVLAGLFERADVTRPIANLTAYLYRSLRNRVVDEYRSRRGKPGRESRDLIETIVDPRSEVTGALEQAESRDQLFAALDRLPREQRDVVFATSLEGRGYREISEETGIPIGTLLARKHRAIRSLRKALEKGPARAGIGGIR